MVSGFGRWLIATGQRCPALPAAISVAIGQMISWFLNATEAAGIAVGIGVALVISRGLARVVTAGILCGVLSAACALVTHVAVLTSDDVVLRAIVDQEPRHPRTGEVVFVVRAVDLADRPLIRCRAVELPWRNSAELRAGDGVIVRGELVATKRPLNPFSWEGWLFRRGIAGELKVRWVSTPHPAVAHPFATLKERTWALLAERYGDRRGAALFLSMAFGTRDILSAYLEGAFQRLGLTHLLVVSGYQVSLVFVTVSLCIRYLSALILPGFRVRAFLPLLSFAFSAVYVLYVGLEASAVRALIAAACVCASVVTERGGSFLQRWAVALLIVQVLMPWAVCDIGVQLTFAALGGIGVGAVLGGAFDGSNVVRTALWVSLATWLFTGCVLVVWGGVLAPAALLCNLLLATPWSVINCVVGSVGLGLFLVLGPWGAAVLDLVVWVNEIVAGAVLTVSETPLATTLGVGGGGGDGGGVNWEEAPLQLLLLVAVGFAATALLWRAAARSRAAALRAM